jgi:hypothetical protein
MNNGEQAQRQRVKHGRLPNMGDMGDMGGMGYDAHSCWFCRQALNTTIIQSAYRQRLARAAYTNRIFERADSLKVP